MKFFTLLIVFLSVNAFATDAACPEETQGYLQPEGITVELNSAGKLQDFANIFLPEKYKDRNLFQVEFQAGVWEFDERGRERKAPLLSGQLQVRKFKGKNMVQLFTSENSPAVSLFIRYGDLCGYTMVYEHTHNNARQ